jgi:transposase
VTSNLIARAGTGTLGDYEEEIFRRPDRARTRTVEEPDRGGHCPRPQAHARPDPALKADQSSEGPGWIDEAVAEAVETSQPTVSRVRKQYVVEGLEAALNRRAPNREYHRKLDGEQEARLVALACSEPPEGRARWSLRLLADKLAELEIVEEISYQTVGRVLKKTPSSRT